MDRWQGSLGSLPGVLAHTLKQSKLTGRAGVTRLQAYSLPWQPVAAGLQSWKTVCKGNIGNFGISRRPIYGPHVGQTCVPACHGAHAFPRTYWDAQAKGRGQMHRVRERVRQQGKAVGRAGRRSARETSGTLGASRPRPADGQMARVAGIPSWGPSPHALS